ncbi:hypothetical protein IWX81_002859 [Salinibacterium sp. CAN_S4]|uniref:hypothetical protein n=1 Tax=Salinibacterium sp. CAN_S4 TaxID=2787727 RepID=UPI0018F00B1A
MILGGIEDRTGKNTWRYPEGPTPDTSSSWLRGATPLSDIEHIAAAAGIDKGCANDVDNSGK